MGNEHLLTTTPVVNYISHMKYDINSLDELIDALDGPAKAAEASSTSPQAVCNWRYKGYLPPSRHLDTLVLLRRLGKTINPAVMGRTEADWKALGL